MALLKAFLILTVVVACCSATDLFVRPKGCPSDIRLDVQDSYREIANYTVDRCAATCLADGTWCRSFSYFDDPANATKVCVLNIGHSDEYWTGLRYAQYWSYYERITGVTGVENYGIADISTCLPNTYRDCQTAKWVTSGTVTRQIWLKLDNLSYTIPAYCQAGDFLMNHREGIGFYDISWNRPWEEYKYGFGIDIKNFWMGLDTMYRLTNQDTIFRYANNRCMYPRKINGTTSRLALSDTVANICPYWSIREDGKIVLASAARSLCICEDTVNPGGLGHVQLCGCNEPNRYQFVYSSALTMIMSRRPNSGNRCLRINGDAGGEEIAVKDCNQGDSWQKWTMLKGRYRNYWAGWDLSNNFKESSAVHTIMHDEHLHYKINADPIFSCGCLWAKIQKDYGFSTYDNDRDGETGYNVAMRQAGGDWWTIYGWCGAGEPRFTSQKDASQYNFCGAWLQKSYMTLQADDYWY